MLGTHRQLGGASPGSTLTASEILLPDSRILAVTADLAFYAGVLNAATSAHWRAGWARSLRRAVEICTTKAVPIVIYDGKLPGTKWQWAFDCLAGISNRPRILLAADSIDEDLWHDVLRRHGYDVVERSASPDQLRRVLRFASLSLLSPGHLSAAGSVQ